MEKQAFFQVFESEFETYAKKYRPDVFQDSEFIFDDYYKNNLKLRGMMIKSSFKLAPVIYLDNFYEIAQDSGQYPMEEIYQSCIEHITETFLENRDLLLLDFSILHDFSKIKYYIFPKFISRNNPKMLNQYVHFIPMSEVACIFAVDISELFQLSGITATCTIPISADLLPYGMTVEELLQISIENMERRNQYFIRTLTDLAGNCIDASLLAKKRDFFGDREMYVISDRLAGAAAILSDRIMSEAAGYIGGDFFILPSSVEEVIIMPLSKYAKKEELEDMVKYINRTEVHPIEKLSDKVYYYDAKEHAIRG